jgi:hypothetical protein
VQRIANVCGCQLSWTDTGWPPVLLVPDTFFPAYEQPTSGFFFLETIERRLPYMIEQLKKPIDSASTDETLFFVSQIRQAMLRAEIWQRHELVRTLQYKTSVYSRLLEHDDMRVRYLALALTASNKMLSSPEQSKALRQAIAHEPDPATKTRMIYAIGDMVLNVYSLAPNWVPPWKEVLPDLLHQLSEIESEPLTVRLAACIVMARARPGLLTPPMKPIFVEALINPAKYHIANYSYGNAEQILKTIENLALHDRITILLAALPQMEIVEDAHSALRNLLDYAFFGEIRLIWAGSLKDDQPAERPAIDESKFRRQRPGTWSYPAKPTPINPADLLPFQRHILETALELEIPWMVHSNLLEKYGLPPTRAEVRVLLEEQK